MSPIGRIFIVLNLILAAAFLGWAASALANTEDFERRLGETESSLQAEIDARDDEISGLRTDLETLQAESRRFREERDQAQTLAESLRTQLEEIKRRSDQLDSQIAQISATLGDYEQTIEQITSAKDAALQRAQEAERERDEALQKAQEAEFGRRDAEQAAEEARLQIQDLEQARGGLEEELARLETNLQTLMERTGVGPDELGESLPLIEAAVTAVRPLEEGRAMVVLDVGQDEGVQRGYTFEIFRGDEYKGQVRVDSVEGDFSSAIVVRQIPGAEIAQGDRAATRL